MNFWASLYISLYIFPSRKKNKEGRRGKVVRQLGGCAMSHPLNFPQFRSAGVSRDRFDMPYLPGRYNKPQVLRVVYIIVGSDVVFRGERKDVLSRTFRRLYEWKNRSWKILSTLHTLNYTRLTLRADSYDIMITSRNARCVKADINWNQINFHLCLNYNTRRFKL